MVDRDGVDQMGPESATIRASLDVVHQSGVAIRAGSRSRLGSAQQFLELVRASWFPQVVAELFHSHEIIIFFHATPPLCKTYCIQPELYSLVGVAVLPVLDSVVSVGCVCGYHHRGLH